MSPGMMEFNVRPGRIATQNLFVINQSNEESLFQVYVEGEVREWFRIPPMKLVLKPGRCHSNCYLKEEKEP